MASTSIFDLNSKIVASDLTDKELEKISGGSCTYAGLKYGAGARIYQADGLYECQDLRFRPDKWKKVQ
jgi:bacteriocin-like protein